MTRFKNVVSTPVPVGGRMVAPGDVANVAQEHPDTLAAVEAGHLVRVQVGSDSPRPRGRNSEES